MTVEWFVICAVCAVVLGALVLVAFLAWEICADWKREDVFGYWEREERERDGEAENGGRVFSAPRAGARAQGCGE